MSNFETAIEILLQHEGGFVNDPNDAGGATNFGITQRDNPTLDIPNLTRDDAIAYYKANWWLKYGLDKINDDDLACYVLDHGVNTGMNAIVVVVQQTVNTIVDGQIGPHTIAAINSNYNPMMMSDIQNGLWQHYLKVLAAHPEYEKFRNGWHNRCFSL
jgi:lysozyme family protein